MFDSENNSLVTRVEAGSGVIITYRTNAEGENVFVASVDSDYIASLVTVNAGGTLTLSPTDEARLAAVEARLGVQAPDPAPAPTPATGVTGTTEVNISVNGSDTGTTDASTPTELTYSLVAADGTTLVSENLRASGGAAAFIFELGMYTQMNRNTAMGLHVTPSYADGKLVLTWKAGHEGSTFAVTITSKHADDDIVFTITDY